MSLPTLFRISLFASLALSTFALAYASQVQMSILDLFYFMMGLLLLVAYLAHERWQMTNAQSNIAGLIIGSLSVGWYLFQRGLNPESDGGDVLTTILPWGGVLLGILLLAKLFRPKNAGDYWTIHAIALVQVILACVLAMNTKLDRDDPVFPVLLICYLFSMVWALRNLTLYHDAVLIRRSTGVTITELHHRAPRANLGLWGSLGWFLLVMLAGLTIYFLLPRGRVLTQGIFGSAPTAQTGYNSNLDLNAQGDVEVSEELVFEAQVLNAAGQPVPLPSDDHRWRGDTCAVYNEGRWQRTRADMTTFDRNRLGQQRPNYFRIHVRMDVSRVPESENSGITSRHPSEVPLFTLDPFAFSEGGMLSTTLSPRVALTDHETESNDIDFRRSLGEGLVHVTGLKRRFKKLMYYQDIPEIKDRKSWEQVMPLPLSDLRARGFYRQLADLPSRIRNGRIPTETEAILRRLRERGKLGANANSQDIARALEAHLSASGEYKYNLNRQRQDLGVDPTEDFLCNVKAGHCARYASALALMLRSQGIRCRVVLGFRGSVWNSTSEMHEIRGMHAHAWVEAIVSEKQEVMPSRGGDSPLIPRTRLTWLVLDPTPTLETGSNQRDFLANNLNFARGLWEFFILDFAGPEQRRKFRELFASLGGEQFMAWWRQLSWSDVIWISSTFLALVVFLATFGRRLWRFFLRSFRRMLGKHGEDVPKVAFFARFLRILQRYQLRRAPSQTPAEFIATLSATLAASPVTASVACIPTEVVDQYYAVRFGKVPLEAATEERLREKLDHLETVLRSRA